MRKPLPRLASASPDVLGEQLRAALEAGEPTSLHALADGAVHHLVAAVVRGDRAAADVLRAAVAEAAEHVPDLSLPAVDAARYRVAMLPRVAEVIARAAPGAAVSVEARTLQGDTVRAVLGVLVRRQGDFLRAGEIKEAGGLTVTERRVGQVLERLAEAGWAVSVVRNAPGPVRHYALSPLGAERALDLAREGHAAPADTAPRASAGPPSRWKSFPPLALNRHGAEEPARARRARGTAVPA